MFNVSSHPVLLHPNQPTPIQELTPKVSSPPGNTFHEVITAWLEHVNQNELKAQGLMIGMESGADNLIETVLAIKKANRSMQLFIQTRNRLVEAWHEVLDQPI